jgi:hypothetical protein
LKLLIPQLQRQLYRPHQHQHHHHHQNQQKLQLKLQLKLRRHHHQKKKAAVIGMVEDLYNWTHAEDKELIYSLLKPDHIIGLLKPILVVELQQQQRYNVIQM